MKKKCKLLGLLIGLCFHLSLYSQSVVKNDQVRQIDDLLTFYQFEDMRSYIWEKGDKKEYCTNSGLCPHIELKKEDTDVYLVSYSDKKYPVQDDYTVLYIVTSFEGNATTFYVYIDELSNVYWFDYKGIFNTPTLKNKGFEVLKQQINTLKQLILK